MPCYDPRNHPAFAADREREANHRLRMTETKLHKVEAMLCGVMTLLEGLSKSKKFDIGYVYSALNYKEMGISESEFKAWWTAHKAEDRKRKKK